MVNAGEGRDSMPTPNQTGSQIYENVDIGGVHIGRLEVQGRVIDGDKVVGGQPVAETRPQTREVITSVATPQTAPAGAERETPPTEEIVWDERGQELARKAVAEATDLTAVLEKGRHIMSNSREDDGKISRAKETADNSGLNNALASTGKGIALTRVRKSLPVALDGVMTNNAVFEKAIPLFLAESASTGMAETEAREMVFRLMCEVASIQQARSETTDVRARATQLYIEAVKNGELPSMTNAIDNFKAELEDGGRRLKQVLEDIRPYLARIEDQEKRYPDSFRAPTQAEVLGMLGTTPRSTQQRRR